ncbi:MAG TPA: hypothetical protein PK089_09525 [Methanoregulaceae archaeon]|nr:hypothetical protein [Methanoregulaceae archaeon]HQJ87153.1 hypothetical protein [Methanoregulaceae archaeon]
MEITDTLRSFLESGEDWERKPTSVPGVFLIKLPKTRTRPASLALELNPIGEGGLPIKRKGIMIMNSHEHEAFRTLLENPKIGTVLAAIEQLFPERRHQGRPANDVVEI